MSGNFYRNKLKYLDFLKKRCNVKSSAEMEGPTAVGPSISARTLTSSGAPCVA